MPDSANDLYSTDKPETSADEGFSAPKASGDDKESVWSSIKGSNSGLASSRLHKGIDWASDLITRNPDGP